MYEVPARPLPIGAGSRYLYANMWRRFVAFQATAAAAALPLTGQVAAFVTTLTPAQAKLARAALKCYLGPRIEWDMVPRVRHRRNEARLRATLLTAADRATLAASALRPRDRALLGVLYVVRRSEAARPLG
jgi:hypothetical protein